MSEDRLVSRCLRSTPHNIVKCALLGSRVFRRRHLGRRVTAVTCLRWPSINTLANKANSIMGIIRRTYTYLDPQSFKLLFKSQTPFGIWSPDLEPSPQTRHNWTGKGAEKSHTPSTLTERPKLWRSPAKAPTTNIVNRYRRLRGD